MQSIERLLVSFFDGVDRSSTRHVSAMDVVVIVEGDPIQDISILQDTSRLLVIMQGGNAYKNPLGNALCAPPDAAERSRLRAGRRP
jgi:hypothetical protein